MRALALWTCCLGSVIAACGGDSAGSGPASGSGANAASSGSSGTNGGVSGTTAGSGGTHAGTSGTGGAPGGGGSTAGGAGASSGAVTRAEACIEYVRGYCELRLRCSPGSDFETCMSSNTRECPDSFFSDGSVRTIEGMLACADEWRSAPCRSDGRETVDCALPGMRASGQACVFTSQCASQLCIIPDGETCGTCAMRLGPNEPCQTGVTHCERGHLCSSDTSTCVPEPEPEPVPAPAQPAYPMLGEACDQSIGCGGTEVADCREEVPGSGDYRCLPWPTLGEDCSPLSIRTCLRGDSYCDISGTCFALPVDGEPCGVDGWTGMPGWCEEGLRCDTTVDPALCRPLPGAGGECSPPAIECGLGLSCVCDDDACDTRHCWRVRQIGESCTDPNDRCLPGPSRCEAGSCVPLEDLQGLFETRCG